MFTSVYILVALACGLIGYKLALRSGRNALAWGWACVLFIVPLVILLLDGRSRRSFASMRDLDRRWGALATYDAGVRAAVERLQPYGPHAVAQLKDAYAALENAALIPNAAEEITQRWATYAALGYELVEVRRGVEIMRDGARRFHVEGQETGDLSTARAIAAAASRAMRRS